MKTEKTYIWANEWICEDGGCDDRVYSDGVRALDLPSAVKDKFGRTRELALIVDVHEDGELVEQQWAYVKDGDIPSHFEVGLPVPGRFQAELHKYFENKI